MVRLAASEPGTAGGAVSVLPWLHEPLVAALARRQPHAMLVHGPQGIGQVEFALALAQAWLCETPAELRPGGLACGHCASCRLIAGRSHPDLRLVVPEASRLEVGLVTEEGADDDGKKKKPSREIKVEQVRAALHFSELTAGRGALKVVVIHPAEALNAVSANALLKTLEEPPGDMRFVLSSGAPQTLLPTIRSRCQLLRLATPPDDAAQRWLAGQGVTEPVSLLAASGGQPLLALAHARAGRDGRAWGALPGAVETGDTSSMAAWPLPVVIDALAKVCHDRVACLLGAPARYFPDWKPRGTTTLEAMSGCAAELRAAARHAEHPWNTGLALEALVNKVQSALGLGQGHPAASGPGAPHRPVHLRHPAR